MMSKQGQQLEERIDAMLAEAAPAAPAADPDVPAEPRPMHTVWGLQLVLAATVLVVYVMSGPVATIWSAALLLLIDVPVTAMLLSPRPGAGAGVVR